VTAKLCQEAPDLRAALLAASKMLDATANRLEKESTAAGLPHHAEFWRLSARDCRKGLKRLPPGVSDIEAAARLRAAGLDWIAEAAEAGIGNYHRLLLW